MKVLYFGFIALIVLFCNSCLQVTIKQQEEKKATTDDKKQIDSIPYVYFRLMDRASLFTHTLIHESDIYIGYDNKRKIQPLLMKLEYRYHPFFFDGKIDSLKHTLENQKDLLFDFVFGDSLSFVYGVDYCLKKLQSDTCATFFVKIDLALMPTKKFSEYEKAKMFASSLNRQTQVDTTNRNLGFTITSFYPTNFELNDFFKELTECYARLLYVYFFRDSKKFDVLTFTIKNVNQYGYTDTLVFTYKKSDYLFATIKEYIQSLIIND